MAENRQEVASQASKTDEGISKIDTETKLNDRQAIFVKEYLIDLNATRAVIAAGYSERSARQIAASNMAKPYIRAAIDLAMKERAAKLDISAEAVIAELARIGFADMADFVEIDESGSIRCFPLDALEKGKSRIIKRVKEKRVIRTVKGTKEKPDGEEILDSTYEFELCDKVKSLELLSRHLGLLHDRDVEVNVPVTIIIRKFSE